MVDHDDEHDEFAEELVDLTSDRIVNAVDRIADAICRIALSPKAIPSAQKKLDKLERKQAAIAKENAEREAAFDGRETELAQCTAAIAAREVALEEREASLASSLADAHNELYQHHARVDQAHRQLVHRIMSTAGILGDWNFQLQDPPSWSQLQKMVAGLPDDPTPAAEVVSRETREDWTGHTVIADSSLTRSISHKATSQ